MTDIVERLRKLWFAQNPKLTWDDMEAITEEAADEITRLRADLAAFVNKYDADVFALRAENEKLRRAMHEIYEVYAGSEGNIEHAEGHYLVYLIREMADIAAEHKKAPSKHIG